jgi:HD-GYP domain-containing protein (c-di-GMP phosphodiesterase class II)
VKILLVLEDKGSREMVAFALESKLKAELTESNAADAAMLLRNAFPKKAIAPAPDQKSASTSKPAPPPPPPSAVAENPAAPKFDLVVAEFNDAPGPLLDAISDLALEIPSVLLTHGKSKNYPENIKKVVGVVDLSDLDGLIAMVERSIKRAHLDEAAKDVTVTSPKLGELCRIRTSLLLRVSPLRSDIYIRLSDIKFVKLFQEGTAFEKEDFDKYMIKKNVPYFYIKVSDCGEFIQKFTDDLTKILNAQPFNSKVAGELTEATLEATQELILRMGPTHAVQTLVKTSVAIAVRDVASSPKLSQLLSRINRDKEKYLASHSLLLGQIACTIATSMAWSSEMTYYKLNLAAFLHDITILNPKLAPLRHPRELKGREKEFTKADIDEFTNHTMTAAELSKRFTEVPPDVDAIIAQHHEEPDGTGFPRGLTSTRISPLAAIFIVAHDLLHFILMSEGKPNIGNYLKSRNEKYNAGTFKKIMKTISEMPL